MKVVLHYGTAPANGALKTHTSLKRVAVTDRGVYAGCLGQLDNPTELEAENPAEGGEIRPQPSHRLDNAAAAASG